MKDEKIYKNKKLKYNCEELINAYFNPSILHYGFKPWKKIMQKKYGYNMKKNRLFKWN